MATFSLSSRRLENCTVFIMGQLYLPGPKEVRKKRKEKKNRKMYNAANIFLH